MNDSIYLYIFSNYTTNNHPSLNFPPYKQGVATNQLPTDLSQRYATNNYPSLNFPPYKYGVATNQLPTDLSQLLLGNQQLPIS